MERLTNVYSNKIHRSEYECSGVYLHMEKKHEWAFKKVWMWSGGSTMNTPNSCWSKPPSPGITNVTLTKTVHCWWWQFQYSQLSETEKQQTKHVYATIMLEVDDFGELKCRFTCSDSVLNRIQAPCENSTTLEWFFLLFQQDIHTLNSQSHTKKHHSVQKFIHKCSWRQNIRP